LSARPWWHGLRLAQRVERFGAALAAVAACVALAVGAAFVGSPSGTALGELPNEPLPATGARAGTERPSVLFVGDVAFAESYFAAYGPADFLDRRGYAYPWQSLRALLGSADLVVANLETPLTGLRRSPLDGRKSYVHWGDPERTSEALALARVGVVSLANNHAMDFLEPGLRDTRRALAARGIVAVGAGASLREAARPYRHELRVGRHLLRLGLLAFRERRWQDFALGAYASGGLAGVYGPSTKTVTEQIRALRLADPRQWLVAFPHWGENYTPRTAEQTALGHALVEAGASLVVGHGAHVLQPVERYKDRWLLYGLGNFAFLSSGRFAGRDVLPYGMAARIELRDEPDGVGMTAKLYFIHSDNLVTGYQPRLLDDAELAEAVALLLQSGEIDPAVREGLAAAARLERDAVGAHLSIELGVHPADAIAP
jgi:hypothetical protein